MYRYRYTQIQTNTIKGRFILKHMDKVFHWWWNERTKIQQVITDHGKQKTICKKLYAYTQSEP